MASANVENKTEENIAVSSDQHPFVNESVPVYDTSALHEHAQTCDDPTHNHQFPSFIDPNDLFSTLKPNVKTETPAKRKNKKNQKQGAIRAEAIPGHRGNENIDDLVNFINSPSSTNDKKQKKKPTTTTN